MSAAPDAEGVEAAADLLVDELGLEEAEQELLERWQKMIFEDDREQLAATLHALSRIRRHWGEIK